MAFYVIKDTKMIKINTLDKLTSVTIQPNIFGKLALFDYISDRLTLFRIFTVIRTKIIKTGGGDL